MNLDELRGKVDEVDEKIIKLLAKRFELTSEIGYLKARQGIDSISPEWESLQFTKYKKLAKELELPSTIVEGIFRQIIDQVIRDHNSIERKPEIENDA